MILSLLGMPGAGKTTLGRQLAAHFALPFLDLDAAIEARAGRGIPAIFAAEGETYFRQLEAAVLREVLAGAGPLVLATGGGTPCFHDNLAALQAAGPTLWLDVPVPVLASRLRAAAPGTRPLLAAAQDAALPAAPGAPDALETRLDETLAARRQFYAAARLRLPAVPDLLPAALALLATAGYGSARSLE